VTLDAELRELAPRALGVLVRRHGSFEACEDAVQEALVAASRQWPQDGRPRNPLGWLITTASRRLVEVWRSESARRRREERYALEDPGAPGPGPADDDTLPLLFLCCHPVLTPPAQVALTLRALGGLTTAEIARALLVPETTVAQRISRAKSRIRAAGAHFLEPTAEEVAERLPSVLQTLYLVFTEGHTASSGPSLQRVELSTEAIRLARQLRAQLPDEGEVAGLLALMLLTDARRPARTTRHGALVPLAEHDRSLWDADKVAEGVALLTEVLPWATPGPFQLEAAIAAVHDEAPSAEQTDWPQILALYDAHALVAPGPMVTLGRVVAVAEVRGPAAGLAQLDVVAADPALARHYRVDVVRAHLLDRVGDRDGAREAYLRAALGTRSQPEQQYLLARAGGPGTTGARGSHSEETAGIP